MKNISVSKRTKYRLSWPSWIIEIIEKIFFLQSHWTIIKLFVHSCRLLPLLFMNLLLEEAGVQKCFNDPHHHRHMKVSLSWLLLFKVLWSKSFYITRVVRFYINQNLRFRPFFQLFNDCQIIKSFCKHKSMITIHSNWDRNWCTAIAITLSRILFAEQKLCVPFNSDWFYRTFKTEQGQGLLSLKNQFF